MKFADINGCRAEATKGIQGRCPVCREPVIAKCGDQRIHHWAHKSNKSCDPWWENETSWHRNWKNLFPKQWQEHVFTDSQTGERHIADVATPHNLIIEFQHSHISSDERKAREVFYTSENRRMIWIVDGTRLKNDYKRFSENLETYSKKLKDGIFEISNPKKIFNEEWCSSSVPVIFDFKGESTEEDNVKSFLYCLFPPKNSIPMLVVLSRDNFITSIISPPTPQANLSPLPRIVIPPSPQWYRYQHTKRRRF